MFARHVLLAVASAILASTVAEPSPPARIDVVARIYNTARMAPATADVALNMAARVMIAGAIDVAWKTCDMPDVCATVPAREFVIRLVRSRDDAADGRPLVLGEASIDVNEQAGVLATIYVDRVERMAALSDADTALLLGRAIAHELGHLLLATNAHSSRGLMRAQWTAKELRRNQSEDWMLTRKNAEAIRRRLTIATKTAMRSKDTKKNKLLVFLRELRSSSYLRG